ncbi:uncharacterized protein LOC119588126, partial [Penaeus monodon]|uniref:uncharacterized protein LOC119588126 n=1 Tax=Penaeus monodon TaxID=6687 RepID=UPI0018A7C70B
MTEKTQANKKHLSQRNGGVRFAPESRPVTRAREVDYDTDDGGVYRAKTRGDYSRGAKEILDSTDTKIELPVDFFDATECRRKSTQTEALVYSRSRGAPFTPLLLKRTKHLLSPAGNGSLRRRVGVWTCLRRRSETVIENT